MSEFRSFDVSLSAGYIKEIAEAVGIPNILDGAAQELADDVTYKLKHILKDATKFMHHAKRIKLLRGDVDASLRAKNTEPQYGFSSAEPIPFRFSSGGGRELNFTEEKAVPLDTLVQGLNQYDLPPEVALRSHWLCIDGIQPTVPENPPPVSKNVQKIESVDPANKIPIKETSGKPVISKRKLHNMELSQVKQLATHELSVEQQLYFKEITEACVSNDDYKRIQALESLQSDAGLHEMLPRLCTFIVEGVRVNVVHDNLTILIYLMRMIQFMVGNSTLNLEQYLHDLVPCVMTCIVGKKLALKPELEGHWMLRDFSTKLIAQICSKYNSNTNNLQTRVTRVFGLVLQDIESKPLTTIYGAIRGLVDLGNEVIRVFILPKIKSIADRIQPHMEDSSNFGIDKVASEYIEQFLVKNLVPVLRNVKDASDTVEDYVERYGYLGPALYEAVLKARTQPLPAITTQGNLCSGTITGSSTDTRTMGTSSMEFQQNLGSQRIVLNQSSRMASHQTNQRIYYVTQKPSTSVGVLHQSSGQLQHNTIVKFVSNTGGTSNQQMLVLPQDRTGLGQSPNQ